MSGTFSPPPRVRDPGMHHGTCVTHVPWCMSGSLTCGFLWSWWREKRSRHSRRMRNPHFYVSGKRPMEDANVKGCYSTTKKYDIPWTVDILHGTRLNAITMTGCWYSALCNSSIKHIRNASSITDNFHESYPGYSIAISIGKKILNKLPETIHWFIWW